MTERNEPRIDETRDVILRDGRTLRLRPPVAEDAAALVEFLGELSEQSRLFRFHGLRTIDPELVAPFVAGDGIDRGGLLGSVADRNCERVVALATWARLRDRSSAEVAFAVDDALQGIGVGTRLLEQLAGLAGGAGIETFVAEVMPANRAMLGVFADAGFDVSRALAGGTIEVRFPITPTAAYREAVDERDHVAVVASLRPFFAPRSVAVVGASARTGSIGGTIVRNIAEGGFAGRIHAVNRSARPVAGVAAVRSFEEIGEPVDLAVIVVPAATVLAAATEALTAGTRALCVITAGFAETGTEGAALQQRLLATVRAHGARLIGPNCLGIAVSASRLNATFARRAFPPGSIGFASQSGALGLALLEAVGLRGLGISAFVSVGNKADVSSNDLLEWWLDDPETELVLLYLESFGNPRKFGRVARRLAGRKPVLAIKSGTSRAGARAASSHTAALAGSEAAVDALFRQAGVTRASSLEELLDVAALYASGAAPRGRRVGVLTNAGGLGILCADACESAGLELPALSPATVDRLASLLPDEAGLGNPVDMLGSAIAATYAAALPPLLADQGLDAVIVLFVPAASATAEEVAAAVANACPAEPEKPVLAVVMSERGTPAALREKTGIAGFSYPESAARALGRAAERTDWLRRPLGRIPDVGGVDADAAHAVVAASLAEADDRWLTPDETHALLGAYGVPIVPEFTAAGVEDAVEAAAELGYPVAVKTGIAGVHKTDVGGVELDLESPDAVRGAAERIGPPLLVQPMVEGGVELLAGLVQDPLFGPLVAFGAGGKLAELIGEASFRIAPLTEVDTQELLEEGKAGRLVRGFRGGPPAYPHALADLLHRLSRLGEDRPEVAELDLNPVLAFPDRCVCVDARIRVRHPTPGSSPKTW